MMTHQKGIVVLLAYMIAEDQVVTMATMKTRITNSTVTQGERWCWLSILSLFSLAMSLAFTMEPRELLRLKYVDPAPVVKLK
jgi:hypothetical protein